MALNFSTKTFGKAIIGLFGIVFVYEALCVTAIYFCRNVVIKPTLAFRDRNNATLRNLEIHDWCDPIPCPNVYLILSNKKALTQEFNYCAYSQISGNIHITGPKISHLPNFGSNIYCYVKNIPKLICNKDKSLTTYKIYSLFPVPKRIPIKFYSCQ